VRARIAWIIVAVSTAAPAQQLGTLFHSPREREALERMRRGETVEQAAAPLPDPVVTGFVKRSDGKSTVFIDKRPYPARDPRMQGVLDPRIVERYEPVPLPPAPAPAGDEEAADRPRPAAAKNGPAAPPGGGKAE
jgi:hypothetical protein